MNHHLRHSVLTHLAVITGLGLLTAGSYCASAAPKKEPVYSEIPGVTTPGTADTSSAPVQAPLTPPTPAPARTPLPPPTLVPVPIPAPVVIQANPPPPMELQTTNKLVFAFQAPDLD